MELIKNTNGELWKTQMGCLMSKVPKRDKNVLV